MLASLVLPALAAIQAVAAAPHIAPRHGHHDVAARSSNATDLAARDSFTGRTTYYTTTDSNPMTACGILYR